VPKNGGVVTEQRVDFGFVPDVEFAQIGRASCRERVWLKV
jgi:hypothetical protein